MFKESGHLIIEILPSLYQWVSIYIGTISRLTGMPPTAEGSHPSREVPARLYPTGKQCTNPNLDNEKT